MTRISPLHTLAVAALAWVGSACGPEDGGSSSVTVRDSAGIRLVELPAPAEGPGRWSIAPEPVLESGWREGDPQFQSISAGSIMRDRVVITDARSNVLTVLPLDGGDLLTLGAPGEGPGEFGRLDGLVVLGSDSILVSDSGNLRVTWYVGGEYAHDRRFEGIVAEAVYRPVSRTPGGSFTLVPSAFALRMDMEPGWKEYPVLGTRDFARLDTLASVPMMRFPEPDNRNPLSHFGFAFPAGDGFAQVRTDRAEVIWRDATGTVRQIARWDQEPREATEEDWAAWERNYRSRSSPRGDAEAYEQRIRGYHDDFGGPVPLFGSQGLGDDAGNVWLAEQTFLGIPDTYLVLSGDGQWIGRVVFPRPIQILDLSDDLVLGTARDELDVQGIVVYRVVRGGG